MNFSVNKPKSAVCSTETKHNSDNCCTSQREEKAACPSCHQKAKAVSEKTFNALVKEASKRKVTSTEGFYYCKTPSCKTIYFQGETVLIQEDMSVVVGLKEGATPAIICYCFDWSKEKIKAELEQTGKTVALDDIKAKMQKIGCSCERLNPSGRCCLDDIAKMIKELKET